MLILPFETLKEDIPQFLKTWLDYLQVREVNSIINTIANSKDPSENARSISRASWHLRNPAQKRFWLHPTRFFRKLGINVELDRKFFSKRINLAPELAHKVMRKYKRSNKLLEDAVPGLDLDTFGYF